MDPTRSAGASSTRRRLTFVLGTLGLVLLLAVGVRVAAGTRTFVVAGVARYERPLSSGATLGTSTTAAPVSFAEVHATDARGAVVARGATDAEGGFRLEVPRSCEGRPLQVVVASRSALEWAPIAVTDHRGQVHAVSVTAGPPTDLLLGAREGGAFHALALLVRGVRVVREVEPGFELPPLTVRWAPGEGSATWFDPDEWTLHLRDQPAQDIDVFDDSMVLHELGHALQLAASSWSSPGGPHLRPGAAEHPQDLDPRLAFAEGWANTFAQLVLGEPRFIDTRPGGGDVLDLESPHLDVLGPGSEAAVHGLLWDLADGAPGGPPDADGDPSALGFASLWRALVALRETPHVSVADFAEALTRTGALEVEAWDRAAAPFGLARPFLAPGAPLVPGAPVEGTLDASLGQGSLRAANASYEVVLGERGRLLVTLERDDYQDGELDLAVTAPTGRVFASNAERGPERVEIRSAPPGRYLVRVKARSFPLGSAQARFRLEVE